MSKSSVSEFENRKKDHIRLSLDSRTQALSDSGFSKIKLIHCALPEFSFSNIDINTELLEHKFNSPHFVSSMTAGHGDSFNINLNLASSAVENGWLMAVGSQRRELGDKNAETEWKKIRSEVPNVKLISNIGVLELIKHDVSELLGLIENLQAVGLYIHFNSIQEVFQNNINIDLSTALQKIEALVKKSSVPILAKEVGFGISKVIAEKLFNAGVMVVDVAGAGGTHWGQIEALRQDEQHILHKASSAFSDWGMSTVDCLLDFQGTSLFKSVWASGGIRNGVDSAKSLALGARAVGVAQPLMQAAVKNREAVSQKMKQFDLELKIAMFGCGISNISDFQSKKVWYGI